MTTVGAMAVLVLYAYTMDEGPCPCGEKRGHTGWLVCALNDSPTPGSSASSQETHAPIPPPT